MQSHNLALGTCFRPPSICTIASLTGEDLEEIAATKVTKAPTFREVFQWKLTAVDSIRKKTVAATMAMEMIQKEMATGSLGSKKPFKAGSGVNIAAADMFSSNANKKTRHLVSL